MKRFICPIKYSDGSKKYLLKWSKKDERYVFTDWAVVIKIYDPKRWEKIANHFGFEKKV